MAKMLLVIAVALIVGSLDANAACTQALPACPPLTTNNSAACLDALCNEQAWPNGIVPFGFTNLRPDANIFEAMRAIEEASCGGVLFIHNTSVHGRSLELRRAQRPTGGCVSDGTGAPLADGSRRVIDMDITCLDIIGRGPGGSRRYDGEPEKFSSDSVISNDSLVVTHYAFVCRQTMQNLSSQLGTRYNCTTLYSPYQARR